MSLFPAKGPSSFGFKDIACEKDGWFARDWLAIHDRSLEPYEGMTAFAEKRKADDVGVRERAADPRGSSEFLWGPYAHECPSWGAKGMPSPFEHCGTCGADLKVTVGA